MLVAAFFAAVAAVGGSTVGGDCLYALQGWQLVHPHLVAQDVSQVVLKVLHAKSLPQLAVILLALVNDCDDRVAHSDCSELFLELEVVSSLGPYELVGLSSELQSHFLDLFEVVRELLVAGVKDVGEEGDNAES